MNKSKQGLFFNSNTFVHIAMIVAIFFAASSFPVVAAITNDLPPELLLFLRFGLAAVLFAPLVFYKHGLKPASKSVLFNYFILSLPLVVFFWCMFEGLRYTSVLNTGALYTLVPAFTAIFGFILNKETTGKLRFFALLLGTFGALWIVFRGDLNAFLILQLNYGDFIFLVGCFFLGLYNPLVKRFHRDEPTEVKTFWILLFGSLLLLFTSASDMVLLNWSDVEYTVYFGVIYLAVFATLLTFFVINFSTVRIGATQVAAYGFLTPPIVILLSIVLGLESFELITLPGLLLIITAMLIIQIQSSSNKKIKK